MDQVMVYAGMHRIDGKHLLGQCIERLPARHRNAVLLVVPDLEYQERFGLDIVRELEAEFFQCAHQCVPAASVIGFLLPIIGRPRLDP